MFIMTTIPSSIARLIASFRIWIRRSITQTRKSIEIIIGMILFMKIMTNRNYDLLSEI